MRYINRVIAWIILICLVFPLGLVFHVIDFFAFGLGDGLADRFGTGMHRTVPWLSIPIGSLMEWAMDETGY